MLVLHRAADHSTPPGAARTPAGAVGGRSARGAPAGIHGAGDRPAARRLASTGRAIGRPGTHHLWIEPELARARAVARAVFDAARGRQGRRPAPKGQALNTGRHLPRLWLKRVATTTRCKVRPTASPRWATMSAPTCQATPSRIPYVTMEPAGFLTLPRKKTAIRRSWRSKRRSRMEGIRTSATSSAGTRRTGPGQDLTPKSASPFIFFEFRPIQGLPATRRPIFAHDAAKRRRSLICRGPAVALARLFSALAGRADIGCGYPPCTAA